MRLFQSIIRRISRLHSSNCDSLVASSGNRDPEIQFVPRHHPIRTGVRGCERRLCPTSLQEDVSATFQLGRKVNLRAAMR